jgi:RNA polymerase sigma-70 factor (ECF subfamily)
MQGDMTVSRQHSLREIFLLNYDDLKVRLTQRLGSSELAADALQDTWLRLENVESAGPVHRPRPYILQIAYNIALKRLRRERHIATLDDARAALSLVDEAPDAAQVAEARSELLQLRQAVEELTPRRREILFASRLSGTPLHVLAERHGISQRMVERELKQAVLHCAKRLGRRIVQRFGPGALEASTIGTKE